MREDDDDARGAGMVLLLTAQGIVWLCIGLGAGWWLWAPT